MFAKLMTNLVSFTETTKGTNKAVADAEVLLNFPFRILVPPLF